MSRNFLFWMVWIVGTVAVGGYLSAAMIYKGDRSLFLIGETTSGHHQIELACNACHTKGFSNIDTIQEACLSCHAAELKISDDSHPLKKFRDPRNADRLEKLDVTKCVTCHTEHRPELTQPMGLTMPKDYCFHLSSGDWQGPAGDASESRISQAVPARAVTTTMITGRFMTAFLSGMPLNLI